MRHFRGSPRRSMRLQPIVKSYKKVLFFAEAAFTAGFTNQFLVQGTDNISPTQSSQTDGTVPTGSIVKYIEVQFAISNLVSTPCYITCSLQYTLAGQSPKDPVSIGGNNQRNQVLHMDMYSVGANQNSNHKFRFKIPKKFQRVREGMNWALTWATNVTVNNQTLVIYKFYS